MGKDDKKLNQSTPKPKSFIQTISKKFTRGSSVKETARLKSAISMDKHDNDNLIDSGTDANMLDLFDKLPRQSKKSIQYLIESIIHDVAGGKDDKNMVGMATSSPLITDEQKIKADLEAKLQSANDHNTRLQERFNKLMKENEEYKGKIDDLEAKLEGFEKLKDSLQKKIESEVNEKENIKQQVSNKEEMWSAENSDNSNNIMLKERQITELKQEIDDLEFKIKNTESSRDRARRKADKLEEDLNKNTIELDQKEKRIKTLEREKQDISARLNRVFNDLKAQEELNKSQASQLSRYNNNEKTLSQVQKELSESRNSSCTLKNKCSILEKEHAKLSNDFKTLDNKYKAQDETILKLKNENVELRRKTEKTVKAIFSIMRGSGGNILDGLVSSVESSIKDEMQVRQIEVHQVPPEQKDVPTVLFCLKSSRLGVDVAKALKQVQGHGTVLLIVVHHQANHVNSPTPSKHILPEATRNQVKDITDIVFWNGAFYSCDFNTSAIETFVNYLMSDCVKEV